VSSGPTLAWAVALVVVLLGSAVAAPPQAAGVAGTGDRLARDVAWTLSYLGDPPRRGDRLPTRLVIALAEREERWAIAYLDRLSATMTADAAASAAAHAVTTATLAATQYHQRLLRVWAAATGGVRADATLIDPRARALVVRARRLLAAYQGRSR